MNRRAFNLALGSAALSAAAQAQTSGRIYRIATLHPSLLINETHPLGKILLNGLAREGFAPGRNLVLEARTAAGKLEIVPKLLQELVAGQPDVIVAVSYPVVKAAESLGVSSAPMEGFDSTKVMEAFGVPNDHSVCCLIALGYASEAKPFPGRLGLGEVCYEEHFGQPWTLGEVE